MSQEFLPASGKAKKQLFHSGTFLKKVNKYKYLYLIFIPVLAWYIIFCYIPMYGIVMAFQDYTMSKGFFASPFVGFANFRELFQDDYFLRAFSNTVIIAVYRMLTEFPFSIILALLLNEIRHIKYRKTIQTVIYLPHFLSWVIVASIFITVFSPENGLVTTLFSTIGVQIPDVLTTAKSFRSVLILTDIWKESGWMTVIYVAAIAAIDIQLYEAATIDGAGRWRQMWYVTLPGIRNTIVIMFILTLGQILTWGFDQVYNFYNPLVYDTGDILDTYIFRTALADIRFSYAAAAGLFRSVICTALLLVSNKIVKLFGEESIY
ncbi:MAG: ABC transporter permease subunit [Bacillota bacterium]|jgi:putative aldouronate transport system permease protein|nr:ABC transporter permease subunit [Bacillota bacterium]NLK65698.1 sugar ABC transporter permease [Tissierellia bacterium]